MIKLYLIIIIIFSLILDLIIPYYNSIIYLPSCSVIAMLFIAQHYNDKYNIMMAFIIGLLLDFVNSYALGSNAFALVLTTYLIIRFKNFFARQVMWQQIIIISFVMFCYYSLLWILAIVINNSLNFSFQFLYIILMALLSGIIWCIVNIILMKLFKINN